LLAAACGGGDEKKIEPLPPCEEDPFGGAAGSGSAARRATDDPISLRETKKGSADDEETAAPGSKSATSSGTAGRGAAGAGGSSGAKSAKPAADAAEDEREPKVPEGVDCPDPSSLEPTMKVSGSVRFDEHTWKGIVHVTGETEVTDAEVTIEPGTVFLVDKGAAILFGTDGEVTLHADGTPDQPIRFCGSDVGPGYWKGVSLGKLNPSSSFENVLIDGAGSEERALGLAADVDVRGLRITNSGGDGIRASLYGENSDDWLVQGAAGSPIVFTGVPAVTRFPKNVTFTENEKEYAIVRVPALSDEELIFHDIGMPYLQDGDLIVQGYGGSKLTFEAGVDYQVAPTKKIVVGANPTQVSEFKVLGTASKPVTIHGSEPSKGSWFGIRISQQTAASKLQHLIISDAGRDDSYALHVKAEIDLQDVTVKNNSKAALFEVAPAKSSENFSSIANDGYALEVFSGVVSRIPSGGTFEENELDMIAIRPGTISPGTAKNLGLPYRAEKLQLDGMLDIEAGTEFVFAKGGAFTIGQYQAPAVLSAIGTSSKPITLRGEDDSNGSWAGLKIASSAGEGCELRYVKLSNAGLTLQRSASVENSTFEGSATYGITKPSSDMTDYTESNTFQNNTQGDVSP
jgi:hypothetical protein